MVTDLERMYAYGFATLLCAYFLYSALRSGVTGLPGGPTAKRVENPLGFWLFVLVDSFLGLAALGATIVYAARQV